MAGPVFKTGVTRPRRVRWVRFPHAPAIGAAALLALLIAPAPLAAQRADSTAAGARRRPAAADTNPALKPPISPRRAFFYSLLAPGFGQSRLDRPNAGALFAALEALSIFMARRSAADLRYAREHAGDSIAISYQLDTAGRVKFDTLGRPLVQEYQRNYYAGNTVHARRTHYEDWKAALVFNHLFAGADAFVAAQLWDLPTRVSVVATPRRATLSASIRW